EGENRELDPEHVADACVHRGSSRQLEMGPSSTTSCRAAHPVGSMSRRHCTRHRPSSAKGSPVERVDLKIDVTDAAGLGGAAHISLTVHVPDVDALRRDPVVCFAKPGGGYSKGYYTVDLPGPSSGGAQAEWHAERGWIFVSVDHLGVGESSTQHDGMRLTYT